MSTPKITDEVIP